MRCRRRRGHAGTFGAAMVRGLAILAPPFAIACAGTPPSVQPPASALPVSTTGSPSTVACASSAAAPPVPASAAEPESKDSAAKLPAVTITQGVRILMRDGVSLNATIYRPLGVAEKLPVVVAVTPYDDLWLYDRSLPPAKRLFADVAVPSLFRATLSRTRLFAATATRVAANRDGAGRTSVLAPLGCASSNRGESCARRSGSRTRGSR